MISELPIEKQKQWYFDAVEGYIVYKGHLKEEAEKGVRQYRLKERLDISPDAIMHYCVEDIGDDIIRDYIRNPIASTA